MQIRPRQRARTPRLETPAQHEQLVADHQHEHQYQSNAQPQQQRQIAGEQRRVGADAGKQVQHDRAEQQYQRD